VPLTDPGADSEKAMICTPYKSLNESNSHFHHPSLWLPPIFHSVARVSSSSTASTEEPEFDEASSFAIRPL